MRRGELCGLKWQDIDYKNNLISIERAAQYLPGQGVFLKEPKNKSSIRVIKLPPFIFKMLKEYRVWQGTERLKCGSRWADGNYVFTNLDGYLYNPDNLTTQFHNFIKANKLPNVSIHSLRHTNATLQIAAGVDVRTVSKRLGHSQTSTTMNIYAHAIKSADEAAAEVLDDLLNPANKEKASSDATDQ